MVAHRRCGKTVACINDLVIRALNTRKDNYRGAYVAPFFNQAKAIAWDYLLRFTNVVPGRTENAAELRVDFPNGSRVQLFGADNPDRLRGMFFDDLVADEYGDWKPSVWPYVIRPALADRQGGAIVIGTPKGRNAFYDAWMRSQSDPDWLCLTLPVTKTNVLPESEVEALRRELGEDAWRQEMLCDFEAALPGAYYGRELTKLREDGRIKALGYDKELPVHTAWDLGYTDDTAIWWYQVIRREVRILECHASSGRDVAFYADLVAKKPYRYGFHFLPHDARAKTLASGGKSIEEMLRASLSGIRIVPDLSVQDGIQAARAMFPHAYIDPSCEEGMNALAQYQREYDEDKKCFREKPRHDWTSHYADAFRMMAVAWQEEHAPKLENKPKFDTDLTISEIIQRNARKRAEA